MSPVVSLALCHCKITITKGKELLPHLSALSSAVCGSGQYIHVTSLSHSGGVCILAPPVAVVPDPHTEFLLF